MCINLILPLFRTLSFCISFSLPLPFFLSLIFSISLSNYLSIYPSFCLSTYFSYYLSSNISRCQSVSVAFSFVFLFHPSFLQFILLFSTLYIFLLEGEKTFVTKNLSPEQNIFNLISCFVSFSP